MKLTAPDIAALSIFDTALKASLRHLLARGMPDNALLKRLFREQFDDTNFPEAPAIIWQLTPTPQKETTVVFIVVSSAYFQICHHLRGHHTARYDGR